MPLDPEQWKQAADAIAVILGALFTGCVALIGAVGAFLKWGVPAWDAWRTKRREELRADAKSQGVTLASLQTEIVVAILRILEALVQETNAERAVVVHVHNCGGPLDVMRFTQSTIVYEEVADGFRRIAPSWQNQPIDRPYVEFVSRILDQTDGPPWLEVSRAEMPANCIERNLFERFAVPRVLKYFIASRENGHWFIALHPRADEPASPATIDHCRASAIGIRDLLVRFETEKAKLEDIRRELEKV